MTVSIKAHYDGKSIVPDEPLDIPVGTPLRVDVSYPSPEHVEPVFPMGSAEERRVALESFKSMAVHGLSIPDEALRRENLYGEDER